MTTDKQVSTITDEERKERQASAAFALASVGLEGLVPSKKAQDLIQRHVNGEITDEELENAKF